MGQANNPGVVSGNGHDDDLCPECDAFRRGAGGHRSLIEDAEQDFAGHGPSHYVRRYSCVTCGAAWQYEHDRKKPNLGWSLKPEAESD